MREDSTHYAVVGSEDSENPAIHELKMDAVGNMQQWSHLQQKWVEFNYFKRSELCGEVSYMDIKKIYRSDPAVK